MINDVINTGAGVEIPIASDEYKFYFKEGCLEGLRRIISAETYGVQLAIDKNRWI